MTLHYNFFVQSPKAELAQLGQVFDTIVEIFLFFDKNGDGKLNKKDMIRTMNETHPRERSPAHITKNRFSIVYFISILPFFTFGDENSEFDTSIHK
jgi:Ca2+-binding EF-hand superfamily protein